MKYCPYCMNEIEGDVCPVCGKSRTGPFPAHHLQPGTVLQGKYVVGAALGEGGFGITYIGKNINLGLRVAIKEFYPNGFVNRATVVSNNVTCTDNETAKNIFEKGKTRFLDEARILARFAKEDGIVSVYDLFEENNTAYIVMEYLEGQTLKAYLQSKGKLTPEETLRLLTPVLITLETVHKAGLIHRDISPDNIMLTGGKVKLLDFGAARDTAGNKSLSVLLKHGYAPEEQYRRKGQQGPWTDVYALCATIYKCITGITPDDAPDRRENDELKPPSALGVSVDGTFEAALMKGLGVHACDRYQTVGELLDGFAGKDQSLAAAPATAAVENGRNETPQTPGEDSASADKTVYGGAAKQDPVDPDKTVYGGAAKQDPVDPDKTVYGGAVKQNPVDPDKTVYGGAVPPRTPPKEPRRSDAGGKKKKKSKKGLLVGLIAAVAAIAAIVAAVVLITGGRKPETTKDGPTKVVNTPTPDTSTPETSTPIHTHDFGKWKTVTAATCTEKGTEERVCDCGEKESRPIEALGHDWGAPTYTWIDGKSKCTAVCTCKRDASHTQTETVDTKVTLTAAATCTTAGSKKYTATFTNPLFEEKTTTDTVAALGHNYVEGVCTRCGYGSDKPLIIMSSASAKAGDTVTVTISLLNNPGIWGADLHISLDSGLTMTGVTYNDALGFTWVEGKEVNTLKLSGEMNGFGNTKYNGVIATLTLKAGQNLSSGDSLKVTVWYKNGDIINADENDVAFTIIPGSVTVTG